MPKPIVKWSGGKGDEIDEFQSHFPETYDTYLEPFIGGGAVFFHLCPQKAVISDVHSELIDLYQAIKDGHTAALYEFMSTHPNDEETYYLVRDEMDVSGLPVENAKRFYYLRKTCYRGMLRYNKSGKFNIPFGRYKTMNFEELKNPIYSQVLGRTKILCGDFEKVFHENNSPENFMFLDPPYDSEFKDYGYCVFGQEEHHRLAKCFKETKIRCLMIIGKTAFIEELYAGYIVGEYDKKYRFKLHSGRVGDEINTKHLIIKNYSTQT